MNPQTNIQIHNIEWFERRIGSWFAILGAIIIPVPFVGLFSILQLLTIIVIGFGANMLLGINIGTNLYSIAGYIGIVYSLLSIVFFLLNIFSMIKYGSYKKGGTVVRLLCYFLIFLINFMYVYFVFVQGETQPHF